MTFLPIAQRELRVAARKRATFWLRIIAALVAVGVGALCIWFTRYDFLPGTTAGTVLFHVLTWASLIAVLSSGLFVTSDCISEEKREGTLGLLFLTDLRGYDIVSGKLLATSLRCFYALLALFPILGITLMMGGVTGLQFSKACLALLNGLFFSLSVGLFVSSLCKSWPTAFSATLLSLLILCCGGPLFDWLWGLAHKRVFDGQASLASPAYVFISAGHWGRSPYWTGMIVTQGIAWCLLAAACVAVPRTWKVGSSRATGWADAVRFRWSYGGAARRLRVRMKLLERNAVLWLSCREQRQGFGLWVLAVVAAGLFIFGIDGDRIGWWLWSNVGKVIILLLYLRVAAHAPRFFIEARRSGLIELLLVGPLPATEIVRGHWRALLRTLGPPAAIIAGLQVATTCFSSSAMSRMIAGGTGAGANVIPPELIIFINACAAGVTIIGNLLALAWFGMWMGLTSKSPNLATLKTFLFAQVLPWILCWISFAMATTVFASAMFSRAGGNNVPPWWFELWASFPGWWVAALSFGKNCAFVLWSYKRLHTSFRRQAIMAWTQPHTSAPIPRPAVSPPVIQAPPVTSQPEGITYPGPLRSGNQPETTNVAGK